MRVVLHIRVRADWIEEYEKAAHGAELLDVVVDYSAEGAGAALQVAREL